MNIEKLKEKIIKKANLKTINDTENLILKYLEKMNYPRLKATEEYILKKIEKQEGDIIANNLFLELVQEKLKKYDK